MEERERLIRLWFDMWLRKTDLGITELFAKDAVYTESWGPQYNRGPQNAVPCFAV